jgi:hypothetical protein
MLGLREVEIQQFLAHPRILIVAEKGISTPTGAILGKEVPPKFRHLLVRWNIRVVVNLFQQLKLLVNSRNAYAMDFRLSADEILTALNRDSL